MSSRPRAKVLLQEWRFSNPTVLIVFFLLEAALVWAIVLDTALNQSPPPIEWPGWISAFLILFFGFLTPLGLLTGLDRVQMSEAGIYVYQTGSIALAPAQRHRELEFRFQDIEGCSLAGRGEAFVWFRGRRRVRISLVGGKEIIIEPRRPERFVDLIKREIAVNSAQPDALDFPPRPVRPLFLFGAPLVVFVPFFVYYYADAIGPWWFYLEVMLSLLALLLVVFTDLRTLPIDSRLSMLMFLMFALSLLISGFGGLYYHAGLHDPNAFLPKEEGQLAKIDALYLSLGTLTTGASIAPASVYTRALAICQMIFSLGLLGIALTVVLPRLLERSQ